jgi:hypothetical protein
LADHHAHHSTAPAAIRASSRVTKQGSAYVRWAAVEAAQQAPTRTFLKEDFRPTAERRNCRPIAKVSIARKIVTLVHYGMRDGETRCLQAAEG